MSIIIVVSALIAAILLLTFVIVKTLIPLAKKKDISFLVAWKSFIIHVNM